MDPIQELCKERSFGEFFNYDVSIIEEENRWIVIDKRNKVSVSNEAEDYLYVNDKLYTKYKKLKSDALKVKNKEIFSFIDPFVKLGGSPYIKLANIDTVFSVTPAVGGFYQLEDDKTPGFKYIDLDSSSMSAYIQYRLKRSIGYGVDAKLEDKGINPIDFEIIADIDTNDSEEENVLENTLNFLDIVKNKTDLVNLVVSNSMKNFYYKLYIGLMMIKEYGSLVLRINDNFDTLFADVVYTIASGFERVTIFKPVTSFAFDKEKYLICYHAKSRKQIDKNAKVILGILEDETISSLYEELPKEYEDWFRSTNDRSLTIRINLYINLIKAYNQSLQIKKGKSERLEDSMLPNIDRYDLHKAIIAMHLPSDIVDEI